MDPSKVRVRRNSRGELEVHLDGREAPLANVKVARCFPWSLQSQYISIRDKDGKEVALLEDLQQLDAQSRGVIQEELAARFFVPKITRITDYRAEFDIIYISAATDRGEVTFQIRSRDDVRILSGRRAIFRDVDGNIYEIPDFHALDRVSQKYLERYF
jgi:hypothetical protein